MAFRSRLVLGLLLVSGLLDTVAATTYVVGGSVGWTFQTTNATFYDDQFKGVSVMVGDSLLFPYDKPVHNVLEVSPGDVAICSTSNVIASYTDSNATVRLTSPGVHGFICGITGHCNQGMHLVLTVLDAAPAPAPTVAPTQPPTVPPVSRTPAPSPAKTPTRAPTPARSPASSPRASATPVPAAFTPSEAPGPSSPGQSDATSSFQSRSAFIVGTVLAVLAASFL